MNRLVQHIKTLSENIKQTGKADTDPPEVLLRAGNLEMKFRNGALRYVSLGNGELIRMVFVAVRDPEWLTVIPVISEENYIIQPDSFTLGFTCRYVSGDIDFEAIFEITGGSDNSLTFSMTGKANRTFKKNRIGICVLHPTETTAGKTCFITHTNGVVEDSSFPKFIEPRQPFLDIKSMRWQAEEGYCSLDFEGDIFETEDQRNWTDASFKTYSTPLSEPYPATVTEGTSIRQRVVFKAENFQPQNKADEKVIRISLDPKRSAKFPSIGIGRTSREKPLSNSELRLLRPLRFDHYRTEILLFKTGWHETASGASDEAAILGARIEFALFVDDNYDLEVNNFITWYQSVRPATACILIFHRSYPVLPVEIAEKILPVLKSHLPETKTGTGTNANFAQLNRNRTSAGLANLVTFSIHPQEHAFDNLTLIENLAAQEDAVRSAAEFSGGSGIWISPVNIRRRFNANKSFIEEPFTGSGTPPQVDARIMSLLGAGWTAISVKYLCRNYIAGITFYETAGERGIMQGEFDSRWPKDFLSCRGMIFPVYHIFRYIQAYRHFRITGSSSSQPLAVDSLVLSDGKQVRMILVNFTGSRTTVVISGCRGMMRYHQLDTCNYAEAASTYNWKFEPGKRLVRAGNTLILEPFSISFVEGWLKNKSN